MPARSAGTIASTSTSAATAAAAVATTAAATATGGAAAIATATVTATSHPADTIRTAPHTAACVKSDVRPLARAAYLDGDNTVVYSAVRRAAVVVRRRP